MWICSLWSYRVLAAALAVFATGVAASSAVRIAAAYSQTLHSNRLRLQIAIYLLTNAVGLVLAGRVTRNRLFGWMVLPVLVVMMAILALQDAVLRTRRRGRTGNAAAFTVLPHAVTKAFARSSRQRLLSTQLDHRCPQSNCCNQMASFVFSSSRWPTH